MYLNQHIIKRHIISFFIIYALTTNISFAANHVPEPHTFISPIANYSKLNNTVAISGRLSETNIQELKKKGFKSIIDLRTISEGVAQEKQWAKLYKVKYQNIPIDGSGISGIQLAVFMKHFKSLKKPVLIHCAGASRAAGMWALYLIATESLSQTKAFKIGRRLGLAASFENALTKQYPESS